jgi:hypothetical protein
MSDALVADLVGVEPVPQPHPYRNPGGDCFACSLLAVLRHLAPEFDAPTFEDTDRWFTAKTTSGTPTTDNTWYGMDKALWAARADGWPIEWMVEQATVPQFDVRRWGHTWPIQEDARGYGRRLQAWLSAGWIGLTSVLYDGSGPYTPDLLLRSSDHFLILDGARQRGDDHFWNNPEIHVVCSAKGDYWVDAQKWQRGYGGWSWLLIRRKDES